MKLKKHDALTVYQAIRFSSALLFSVIVTVNLVYQATVVGLNPFQLVLVGTVLETVTFFFEIPTGIVADVYSRKLSVMIGLLLIGLGFMVEGLFPFFFAILIAQVIWGVGFTFVSGAREAWIADEVGEQQAGKAFSKGAQMSLFGSLIGIALSVFLGNINIRLPIILGGLLYSLQSIYVLFFMPENNFHPVPSGERATFTTMKSTFTTGLSLVKMSPVLLTIVVTGLIFGIFSEGFDRLWTPFVLENIQFPTIFHLSQITWFGILAILANLAAIVAIRFAQKRTNTNNHRSTVKALLFTNGFLVASVIFFGLTTSFLLAAAGFWFVSMFKEARGPLYDAWTNQNLKPKVRATVFSMCSQANAAGQIAGGPVLGLIATVVSLRVSIIASGIVLIPTLFFYAYSMRNHKQANSLL